MVDHKTQTKPGKDTVYVDLDDEITSIIDKVENAGENIVALVLPKRASVLQSIVNIRLLKRASQSAGKNVVLITNDSIVLPLAGAAGLHVAKNLQSEPHIPPSPVPLDESNKQPVANEEDDPHDDEDADVSQAKIDYNRSIGELAASSEFDEPESIPLGDEEKPADNNAVGATKKNKPPKDKRLKIPNFDKFRLTLGLGIGGLILLIVLIVLATSVLPKAKITIRTTSLPVSVSFNATADTAAKELDEEKSILPAVAQKKDQTATTTVNATGQQNNGDKATGSVTMTAQNCSGVTPPSSVSAGSGISSSGLTFITQQKATFVFDQIKNNCNYFKSNSTGITAQTGGSKYNVGSGTSFTVAGRSDVSASGSANGGTDNNTTILSQADVDGAKQKITSTDTDNFSKEFQKELESQDLYVITSTLKLSDPQITSSAAVGSPATTSNVSVKITHSALAVKKEDLRKIVSAQLNKQIDSSKQKLSDSDVLTGLTLSVKIQDSTSKTVLQLSEDTTVIPIIDFENVKKTAVGQKTGDIRSALSGLPGVKDVEVKFSPFWVSKAPKASKITVLQQQVNDSGNTSP